MRAFFASILCAFTVTVFAQPIRLDVDASDAPGLLIKVHETIPVSAGPVALYYPEWIPGEHGPDGPISNLVEVHFHAGGKELTWTRDDIDVYEFHVEIPQGLNELEVDFVDANGPDSSMNANLARISWHRDLLYPGGKASDDIQFQASLKLPEGWNFGSALPLDHVDGSLAYFNPISLTRLIDSPVVAGKYFNKVVLGENPLHEMDIAGDSADDVQVPSDIVDKMKRLVAEEYAYFGARHYHDYHFLLTCSAYGGYMGLEHNESSEDGLGPGGFKNASELGYLVCHEFTHSWNGKFRRPAGLATSNYEFPMKGELLWVYEGFTEFTGTMMTARAGFWTDGQLREALAATAATLDTEQGRDWRPLVDTARSAHNMGGGDWGAERRNVGDYYREMVLIWLEADSIIRSKTNDAKSIDDFAKAFYGPPSTGPIIKPYNFEDVVAALDSVVQYDWSGFLRDRIYKVQPRAPIGGFEGSGWQLSYDNVPNERNEARYGGGIAGLRFSLGLGLGGDGTINDAIFGMPAFKAGLCPGMKITQVNGKGYSSQVLIDAVKAKDPLSLTVVYDGQTESHDIDYSGGLKQPHLIRDSSKPDYLSELIRPHAQ